MSKCIKLQPSDDDLAICDNELNRYKHLKFCFTTLPPGGKEDLISEMQIILAFLKMIIPFLEFGNDLQNTTKLNPNLYLFSHVHGSLYLF